MPNITVARLARRIPYQRYSSPHEKIRKGRGPDTELMSVDNSSNVKTLRGTDGDGEGSMKQEDTEIWTMVEIDARHDGERGSADLGEGR